MLSTLAHHLSRRPRRTLLAVLVFVILAGVIGGPVAGSLRSSGGFQPAGAGSQLAIRQIERATGAEPAAGVVLLVRTPQGARSAAGHAALTGASSRLARVDGIAHTEIAGIAPSGREGFVAGTIRASASDGNVASAAMHTFAADRSVSVGGSAVAAKQVGSTITKDLGFAEALAAPLLIILSILLFRGRAALMPVVVGVTTVLGTFLVMRGVNQLYGLSIYALNLVIGLGLGLAVDYTLFIVTRFREELATGRETAAAIAETMRHAGRTVLFSALTVAAALSTLILFPLEFLKSMGIAGAICALVAATVAVCVSPALLGLWGRKLVRSDTARTARGDGRWYRLAHAVMRRPGPVALLTAAVMAAAAVPALSVKWSPSNDPSVVPTSQSARVVSDALTRDFGATTDAPITVAISAPSSESAQVHAFARRVGAIAGIHGRPTLRDLGHSTWELVSQVHGDSSGPLAQRVVHEIRATPRPFTARVSGDAAEFIDQQQAIGSQLPLTLGLLAALTFLILWLMTGSFVLPLKAIVMNLLTVGAALSAVVVVYQHGRLTGLLHYTPDGGVEPTDFVVSATVVFALSTDYGVFLLARIREARERLLVARPGDEPLTSAQEREAVATGLGATGRVVTGAAILLAVAIGAFSTSEISFIQQIGVAVAVGVLLDAFVVRSLLVPSLMALLGRLNWWAPMKRRGPRGSIITA
ncbi:MAG TPA: MMPL family transporter [Solirubrobacteraceae bacterium]|nr:MMPL family transporter [Solirubrobacteraceae bacterium]